MPLRYLLKQFFMPPGILLLLIALGWFLRRRFPRLALRQTPVDDELVQLLRAQGPAAFAVDELSLWRYEGNGLVTLCKEERLPTLCSDHRRRLREQGVIEDASQVLHPSHTGGGTALDVALLHENQLIGLLCLRRDRPATWEAEDVAFARSLAECLAALLQQPERLPKVAHPLTRVMEASNDAFLLLDAGGRLEHATDSFARITGYPIAKLQGLHVESLPALENWSELLYEAWQHLAHQDSWQGELRCYRRDGETYWGQLSLSKIQQPNGDLQGYLGIFQDTSKTRFAQQHNDEMVFRDSLTGLANRSHFIARLEERLEQSNPSSEHSLLLVDVDNFKRVNDSLGHRIGDQLLVGLGDTSYQALIIIDSRLAKADQMLVAADLVVMLSEDRMVTVPAGFITDCHSTPAFLASVLPEYDNRTNIAAIVHDFLYMEWEQQVAVYPFLVELQLDEARAYADSIYLELMERFNPGHFRNKIYYAGVRLFGWWNWRKWRRQHKGTTKQSLARLP